MLQVYKHNLRKTEYFFPNEQWFYAKIYCGPFPDVCYIIHLNQEIKSETKMLCL